MKDTLRGRPIYRVQEFANGVLKAPDGRPVEAISYYTDAAPPIDGRPIDAVSTALNEGEFIYAVSAYPAGTLITPDGRPVSASVLCDANGVPSASFNPMTMTPNLWVDASDMTTLFQDSARTTPITAPADPIGGVADKSGSGKHLLQATGAARMAFRQTGGKNAINPDGVDDELATAAGQTWPASVDVFMVVSNVEADTSFVLLNYFGRYLGIAAQGVSAQVSDLGPGGAPPAYVNNVSITDRGVFYTAIGTTGAKIVEFRGIDLTEWTSASIGAFAGFPFAGRYHELLICPAQVSGVRTQYRDYLTTKWGVA